VVGRPTLATAEKGERIFGRIIAAVRRAVFAANTEETDTI
jgi:creatinine amidohydrolase/Fe(II)-dependent formamide hydrolase-like protein